MKTLLIRCGQFLFNQRNRLFPVVFVVSVLLARPTHPAGGYRADLLIDLLGLLVAAAGQAIRIFTIGFEYIKRGGKDGQIYADKLVEGGVFAHCRNPMYLGNILIAFGLLIVLNAPMAYLVGVPAVLFVYSAIIAAEEQYLAGKFGDAYRDYCARVNRLWPSLRGFRGSVRDMRFNWRRVLVKEYNTAFGLVAGVAALRAWCLYRVDGAAALPEVKLLGLLVAPFFAAYLAIAWLKHTRRLSDKVRPSPTPEAAAAPSA